VVLTADHGEEIFDHGSFEHGHTAYQELLHVPLMMWGAGIEPERIPTPVSHVDLFPTLLDAAGLALPGDRPGISLLGLLELEEHAVSSVRPILADRTLHGRRHRVLIRWPWKAIDIEGRSAAMLFDLESDPLEEHDLSEAQPERLAAMLAEFETLSPTPDRDDHERRAVALDDALRAQLEALGYSSPRTSPSRDEDL
jgi:arylsulfatase A-like enzyme